MTITMADGYELPIDRPDLVNVGDLCGRGWSIIPLRYRDKKPALPSWTAFQRRRPTYQEIEQWFGPSPLYNIGIVTGAVSGIFVVDCDSPAALAWANANLPPCDMRVRTAKGLHLYYPYSGERHIKNKVRVKVDGKPIEIDIRADGGFVVAPGSTHPTGHVYTSEGTGWC